MSGVAVLLAAAAFAAPHGELFDDFSYAGTDQLPANGWTIRGGQGWPGIRGARWGGVTVGGGVLRLTASTDGTARGTTQAQVCHLRKYREGTYAARVRFHDAPSAGPDGDQVVQSLYAISRFRRGMDPDYSETDFEYLPNGGWGVPAPMLYVTTWETFNPVPRWVAVRDHSARAGSSDGWHVLVMQVVGGRVAYWIDGARLGAHGGRYYPEVPMSINANVWFLVGGLLPSQRVRRYEEDLDWVFHRDGELLSPAQVRAAVAAHRRSGVVFTDTVPPRGLRSSCDL